MTSPQLPPNGYIDAPQQHPNLILGSLQLLFWLVFRPSAWRNHLQRIDPILNPDSSLIIFLRQGRWRNPALWLFLIQGYFILPILANSLLGLVLWILGEPIADIAFRVAVGVAFGVAVGVAFGVALGVAFGVVIGVAFGVVVGVGFGVAVGMGFGVAFGVAVDVGFGVALGVAFGVALGVVFGVAVGVAFGVAFGVAYRLAYRVAKALQIQLDARSLQGCKDVKAISEAYRSLVNSERESEVSSLLRIFSRISEDVDTALNQASAYNQRLALRNVADKLNLHLQDFTRNSDKYTVRFRPIIKTWREVVTNYIDELTKITELRQEIDSPYIIGVPLTQEQEIFTGRNDIGTRIEQLLLDRRRPPLLLYGQRRMGKTSLLNNIGKLLPNTIIPMFVDLQGAPSSASDHTGFLYNLARDMEKSAKKQGVTLPSLAREVLKSDPFTYFYEWLDKVEQALEQNTALLALDEFEVLDNAIAKGRFDEHDILGMLRHLIQHRPRFKVLLAGSHTIEEYQRWASYLINVQVVHISYLKEAEARQLIEHPVKDFTLRYEPNAVERVLQLTRCHPFLVQLLCAEIIVLKNEQDPSVRRLATLADVEAAIPEALQSGGFFFADIQNNQVDATGQAILRFIAPQGEGVIVSRESLLQRFPDAEITLKLLLQRELIEEVEDGYSFQVELIRRWFV
ncbi:MAG: AAA family ATPase [Nostoc sp. DedQUE01]|nr:ATP-binding protein [Nostoc sp. DedQUE01]